MFVRIGFESMHTVLKMTCIIRIFTVNWKYEMIRTVKCIVHFVAKPLFKF